MQSISKRICTHRIVYYFWTSVWSWVQEYCMILAELSYPRASLFLNLRTCGTVKIIDLCTKESHNIVSVSVYKLLRPTTGPKWTLHGLRYEISRTLGGAVEDFFEISTLLGEIILEKQYASKGLSWVVTQPLPGPSELIQGGPLPVISGVIGLYVYVYSIQ